ncbi:hypothetical protein [Paracoccus laeviglucosivorans]|uniref:Anti-sigma factor NepR domain-containing protein n=1 Tax=Paracoccus laeviglucosivorans TaxID=1197861 RepID=A0A521D2K5_9RHOB|nr:hypothetical protein [Paracoccus laeviglucosivorans]SMO65925.1 hypothetical protein SAMN06265221_10631 [Paracoccus laeviglucosivorans]
MTMNDSAGTNPETARLMAELREQTRIEPISPRLMQLARELDQALHAAQLSRTPPEQEAG